MARGLETQTVKQFKGLNLMTVSSNLGPEWAQDCLNVIPNAGGGLEKLRTPVPKSAIYQMLHGLGNFANFQNAKGVRQVVVQIGDYVYKFTLDEYAGSPINQDPLNDGVMSFVQANNLMFMANGQRMMKWDGANFWKWGIDKPAGFKTASAPTYPIPDPTTQPMAWRVSGPAGALADRSFYACITFVNQDGLESAKSATVGPVVISLTQGYPPNDTYLRVFWKGYGYYDDPTPPPENAVSWNLYVGDTPDTLKRVTGGCINGNPVPVAAPFDLATPVMEPEAGWVYGTQDPPTGNRSSIAILAGPLTMTIGRRFRFAYGNSQTGHIGAASDPTVSTGPFDAGAITLLLPAPTDPQCDQIWLYATKDGGSDYYLDPNPDTEDGSWPVVANGPDITIIDRTLDDDLNMAIIAPLLNFPPPVGRYLTKYQGRIFIACLTGAKQDLVYSGYERIFSGRPEESFPPNNRLRLSIGADEIRGIGPLQSGIVVFSKSNEMFSFRGNPEDITTDAPVQYSAFLEQLPWQEGCLSHWTIVPSKRGLIWLGADRCLKLWNGVDKPQDISALDHPFFRSITASQLENCRGTLWNHLEKEFYLLAVPINDSQALNRILLVDLNEDSDRNFGAVPLAIGDVDAFDVVEDADGVKHLIILQGGCLKELKLASTTRNGLSEEGSSK